MREDSVDKSVRDLRKKAGVSPLDRPIARLVAGLCFLLSVAALGYIHRDDLFPPEAVAADDPVARCIDARVAPIDAMLNDKLIDAAKAALFRWRSEGICIQMHGR